MFVDVIAVRMVQVRVVNVIDVIAVTDGEVAAIDAVYVVVSIMNARFHQDRFAPETAVSTRSGAISLRYVRPRVPSTRDAASAPSTATSSSTSSSSRRKVSETCRVSSTRR